MNFFEDYVHGHGDIELSQGEVIVDVDRFISMNVSILKSNIGNSRFRPYCDRLVKLHKILNDEHV